MQAERVVELTFGTLSIGSGYLITPRHVLTARHVVKPLELGTPCTVRPLVALGGGALLRPAPLNARTGWFVDEHVAPDLDVAIIELHSPARVELEPELVGFGTVMINDIEPRSFLCAGFPVAARMANKTLGGTFTYVPGLQCFDLTVHGALPRRNWREWAGLSGAVVLCGGRAVGVVRTVDSHWDRTLTATPVQPMLEHSSFQEYWREQALPRPSIEPILRFEPTMLERISGHVYLFDRKDPVESIKGYLKGLPTPTPSQIIVIPGVEDDEHVDMIRQLAEDAQVQRLLGREAKSEDVIVQLPWPLEALQIDPEERFRIQLERLCASASVAIPPGGQPPNPADLRSSFDQGTTPRAYWTLVSRRIAFGGHSLLLRRLIDFWELLGSGLPVLLFLCIAKDEPEHPRQTTWSFLPRRRLQPEIGLEKELEAASIRLNQFSERFIGVDDLEMIGTRHIGPWIDELRYRCRAVRPGQLEGLRLSLLSRIGQGKRARQVAADVGDLLRSL